MPISSSETPSSAAEDFGPYFFAWADEGTPFDPYLHTRFDDDIFEWNIEQQEGDFASLSIMIQNPRVGLLNPGRQLWGWFSWWNGTQAVPLFFGRLIGLPDNIADETVTLNFIARPTDLAEQKTAIATTLKVRPYWDGIFFDPTTRDDPDNVLESRPEAWHIDRTSLVVTTSNIIDGEDGTASFDEDTIFYDSVKTSYGQNPLRSVTVNATVSWDQAGSGSIRFPNGIGMQPGYTFQSYTGKGIFDDWPKPGDSPGGGWQYTASTIIATGMIDSALVGEIQYDANNGGLSFYVDGGFDTSLGTFLDMPDGTHIGFSYHVAIPNITIQWHLELGWEANRRKAENLTFTLKADVQDIITLPDDGESLIIPMQSSEVVNVVDGEVPIGDPLNRGFFNTDRGAIAIEYLIAVARAHLLARARCVKVDFSVQFENFVAAAITLRKNATISDPHLPGAAAGGKIIAYSFGLQNGAQFANISMGCTIGKNGTHDEIVGTPDYVEEGYVERGYQTYSGAYSLPFDEADVAYESQANVEPNDDGIDFSKMTSHVIQGLQLVNKNGVHETQQDALSRWTITTDPNLKVTAENTRFAYITYTLPDLTNGPFETNYIVNVTDLKIPRTIDLEAESMGASS